MIRESLLVLPSRRWMDDIERIGLSLFLYALVFSIGLASLLAGPLIVHPNSALAHEAFAHLQRGSTTIGPDAIAALGLVGVAVLLKPLLVVAAISSIEMLVLRRIPDRKEFLLLWLTQSMFLSIVTATVMIVQRADFLPPPLLSRDIKTLAPLTLEAVPLFGLMLLLSELLYYWWHRAQHSIPWLWKFHAVHHSHELDNLHNVVHPVDRIGVMLTVNIPVALIVGVSGEELYLLAAFIAISDLFVHTSLPIHLGPFRLLFTDNRYHFVHHSRRPEDYNCNFAARLPIYDRLFGTYRAPRGTALPVTGLADKLPPASLLHYFTARLAARDQAGTRSEPDVP
ncbi:MAG TPA: sterol desaturase family protein [Allosphingosinicella sp.]|nr:sterol desaturase family protein [Allosphingosinicella sp.]